MRKNKFLRAAVLMLALVMVTSCFVGGTFAKYTTGDQAQDNARVAKWGVDVKVESNDIFKNEYKSLSDLNTVVVRSEDAAKVVAPGTAGNGLTITITGKPEVASKLVFDVQASDIFLGDYHPVEFALCQNTVPTDPDESVIVRPSQPIVKGTLEEVLEALNNKTYEPNEEINDVYQLVWDWDFSVDEEHDKMDTILGDLAAAGETTGTTADGIPFSTVMDYTVRATVEQIN